MRSGHAAAYEDLPFRELLHHPAETTRRLDAVRTLRLRHRDVGDRALAPVEQIERDVAIMGFTSRLLAALVRTENIAALCRALPGRPRSGTHGRGSGVSPD